MNWEEQIVAYFKRLRLERNITGKMLAERAGVSQPKISMIETGKRPVTLSEMVRIADFLEVDLADMFKKLQNKQWLGNPPPREIEIQGVKYVMASG